MQGYMRVVKRCMPEWRKSGLSNSYVSGVGEGPSTLSYVHCTSKGPEGG